MRTSEDFDELEQGLTAELQRVRPSHGFADAVMLRIAEEKRQGGFKQKLRVISVRPTWSWLAIAAAILLLLLPATYAVRNIRQRRQAELTQARFELAMRLTSRTLAHVDATIDGTLNRAANTPKNTSSN